MRRADRMLQLIQILRRHRRSSYDSERANPGGSDWRHPSSSKRAGLASVACAKASPPGSWTAIWAVGAGLG